MKRTISIILLCALLISVTAVYAYSPSSSNPVVPEESVKIKFNGVPLVFEKDQQPLIINGRTLIPARVFEAMGSEVIVEEARGMINVRNGSMGVALQTANPRMTVVGLITRQEYHIVLDVLPQIIGGSLRVPLRAISEAFGCEVLWDGENRTAIINTNSYVQLMAESKTSVQLSGLADDEKQFLQTTEYDSDGNKVKTNEYDENQNLIREIHYNADGSIGWWYEFEYSAVQQHYLVKTTYFDSNDSVVWWNEYEYNEYGNKVIEIRYNSEGEIMMSTLYEYSDGENQILVKQIVYDSKNIIMEETEFNNEGKPIKVTRFNADSSVRGWTEINYVSPEGGENSGSPAEAPTPAPEQGDRDYVHETDYNADGNIEEEREYDIPDKDDDQGDTPDDTKPVPFDAAVAAARVGDGNQ